MTPPHSFHPTAGSGGELHRVTAVHVEDSDLDAELFEYYVKTLNLPVDIVRLRDGQEALDYFEKHKISAQNCLVVLDLGLPKICGQDVLKHVRNLDEYRLLPNIIVLSGSSNPQDREECRSLGANAYFVKPFGLVEYEHLIVGPIQKYLQNLVC